MAVGRHPFTRLGVAAVLAAGVGLALSPAASAEGATGTYDGSKAGTNSKVFLEGHEQGVTTNVKLLRVYNGDVTSTLETYCIELDTAIDDEGTKYAESDWDEYFDDSEVAAKVNWTLRHSYPALSIEDLKSELADEPEFDGANLDALTPRTAAAGTQAAIWHFTDGADLDEGKNDEIVVDLYDYLTGESNVGASNEPQAKLRIGTNSDDGSLTAKPGEPFGPLTVHTTSSNPVKLSVKSKTDGVRLVQKTDDGYKKVTKRSDGEKFYVDVPADAKKGKATIAAETDVTVEVGRVFRGVENPDETQTLILASPGKAHIGVEAKFTWEQRESNSPSPTPSETGSNEAPAPTPVHTKAPVTG